jgi:hypothetical protein
MASVVTLIIEKNHEKNIQKKNYFRPTDPNFFRHMKPEPQVFVLGLKRFPIM